MARHDSTFHPLELQVYLANILHLYKHRSDVCQYITPTMIPRMKTPPKIGGLLKRETGGREGRKEGSGTCEPLSRKIDRNSKPATGGDCGTSKPTTGDDCGTRRPATGGDCGTRRSTRIADSGKTGRRRASNKSDSIKAAFLAACEQGDLEKVFNASNASANATWSQDHKIERNITILQTRSKLPFCLELMSTTGYLEPGIGASD